MLIPNLTLHLTICSYIVCFESFLIIQIKGVFSKCDLSLDLQNRLFNWITFISVKMSIQELTLCLTFKLGAYHCLKDPQKSIAWEMYLNWNILLTIKPSKFNISVTFSRQLCENYEIVTSLISFCGV